MIRYSDVKAVHLEISTRCNARCPDCPRNFRGVDVIDTYPLHDMSLQEFKIIFTDSFLKQLEHININGNYGDFVTAKDGIDIVRYAKNINPKLAITISTNAGAKPKVWAELAKLGVTVWFRIDGLEDTHSLYRLNTDYHTVLKNAQSFINAGGNAVWAMIKFDHNKHQVELCRQKSKELRFAGFVEIDQGRNTMPVFNTDKTFAYKIGDYTGSTDFNELFSNYQLYKIHPDKTVKETTESREIKCKAVEKNEIFITATGEVYPCCWLGSYPFHSLSEPSNIQLREIVYKNNALAYGIEQSIEWFEEVERSWQKGRVCDGKLFACNQVCGIK